MADPVPVDHDPFATTESGAAPKVSSPVPVDHDPFKVDASKSEGAKPGGATAVLKNIPRYMWQDFKHGLATEGAAMARAGKEKDSSIIPGLAGPEAALGAAEFAGAPITGAARALLEPFKSVFPQDTAWGQMAYRTLEDTAVIFGPSAVGEVASTLKTAAKPVRELMDSGVQLTLGQISGKLAKRFEEAAKSVPILGTFIRGAEGRTFDSWNVATINKVLGPLGKVDAKNAREAITKAEDIVDAKYDAARAGIPSLKYDKELSQDIIHLQNKIGELPVGLQDQFDAILNNRLNNRFGIVQAMDGASFKKADSELRVIADGLRSSQDNAQRELGHAVTDLRMAMRGALRRQYPTVADKLAEVDEAFGRIADIQRAGSASATSAGRFTPGQYLQSLKRSDRSARDKDFMKGLRPLQDWAEKSQDVIGNKLPDSGSAERLITEGMTGAAGAGAAHFFDPTGAVIPGVVGGSALYSAPGQVATNAVAKAAPAIGAGAVDSSILGAGVSQTAQQAGAP